MQTLEEKQQDGMTGAGPETEFHTELFGFNRVEVLSYICLLYTSEMCGWSEVKIVSVFSFITLVGVVLGGIFVYVS